MTMQKQSSTRTNKQNTVLSLYHLLDPEVLANPYPLYQRLRTEDPVHWDPFLHTWVVTRYADVVTVLQYFSANRIARHLGSDRPFYALEPYSFDGLRVPHTLETIAAAHVKSLRSVQPHGPY